LNNVFYRMQVNLRSVFVLLLYFLYCCGHRKKRNIAQSPRKYAILILKSKKKFSGEKDTLSPHPLLAPSAPRLGSRLRRSIFSPPPTSTPGSAYEGGSSNLQMHVLFEV